MSCGSSSCISRTSDRVLPTALPWSWLLRAFAKLAKMFDRSRRRQILHGLEKARQRAALKNLDDRMLKDIGLTREQAMREARKPFWK